MSGGDLLDRLRRVLQHERQGGHRNRAVIGGIQKHCPAWLAALDLGRADPARARQVDNVRDLLARYDSLSTGEREECLRRALDLLAAGQASPSSSLAAAARESPPRPTPPTVASTPTASPARRSSNPSSTGGRVSLESPVTYLAGVRQATARKLRNLGVEMVRDLLYLFPRRYSEIKKVRDLIPGETQTVIGSVWRVNRDARGRGLNITTLTVADDTGTVQAVLFRAGYGQYGPNLEVGDQVMMTGPVELDIGLLRMKPTEIAGKRVPGYDAVGQLLPVYPLSGDLTQRWVRDKVWDTVSVWTGSLEEHLPEWMREQWSLMPLPVAIRQVHRPSGWSALKQARRRLAFDELLLVQLGMLLRRRSYREEQPAPALEGPEELVDSFVSSLPFTLTMAQRKTAREILEDLRVTRPMMRLLQGDVGSGKTVVAAMALAAVVGAGYQAAVMAPTEILAAQHFRTIGGMMERWGALPRAGGERRPVAVGLLTGSQRKEERQRAQHAAAEGELDIVVGTHALIEEAVEFGRLGLVIVDEQHRFGVTQRAALRQKGHNPHVLAMTATPIPRTLALTLYGDLDLSVIDEMPPGRQPVATRYLGPEDRHRAYAFVRRRVEAGEQAFVICPLIEESDKIEAKAATAEFERLQRDVFPDLKLGLMHGKMKPADKDRVMREFRAGEIHMLVSTSVVEVGIDVPNATVMLVEGADRFGLAQLHQFRGRVGRGSAKSYCVLLAESPSNEGRERLSALERTQNGFELAEEDLRLRGPGEFFGTKQSGLPDLRIATLTDVLTMEEARAAARAVLERDADLARGEHAALARRIASFWQGGAKLE